ncbi:MAG: MFS transporter [Promethearchaeota archaeon]
MKTTIKSSSRVFIGLSSFQMLAMFRRGLFYTFLSIYLRIYLNLSVTETTLYATLPMIMSVLFQNLVWGPISDKFQRRRTLIILGEIIAGVGTIIVWGIHFSFTNFKIAGYVVIIGLTCIEMFWSMSNIGWSALVSDIYPSKKRSKIMGHLTSIGGSGRIIGVFIGGFLYKDGLGFHNGSLFFIASFVMFISTIPMLLAPEGGIALRNKLEENSDKSIENNQNSIIIFIIFIIALIFINFGRNSIAIPFPQFLKLESGFNVDDLMLSFIANTSSFSVILIGFSAGILSKKLGHALTLIFGTTIGIIALIIIATTTYLPMIFLGNFLIGAAEVIIYASSYAFASTLIPARIRAKLFSVYNTAFFLSWGLACTLVSGPLIDLLINAGKSDIFAYQVSFLVGALICLIGLLIFTFLEIWLTLNKRKLKIALKSLRN